MVVTVCRKLHSWQDDGDKDLLVSQPASDIRCLWAWSQPINIAGGIAQCPHGRQRSTCFTGPNDIHVLCTVPGLLITAFLYCVVEIIHGTVYNTVYCIQYY